MKLTNPCSIKSILKYAKSIPFDSINDNQYINRIYSELVNLNNTISKQTISAIFQLTLHYSPKTYIDIGCVILSFATLANDKHDRIYIDLTNGAIATDFEDSELLELEKIQEFCNNLKLIIAEVFSPKVTDSN